MKLTLFHGSIHRVEQPLVALGRKNLDFGQGFYLTTYREQAVQWALRQQIMRRSDVAWLNEYVLDMDGVEAGSYRCKHLEGYDREWLEFIAASRHGKTPWKGYDLIEGGGQMIRWWMPWKHIWPDWLMWSIRSINWPMSCLTIRYAC